MYISNMQHFLDETGNIPKQMPKKARELANYFAFVIDATTKEKPSTLTSTDIRCFKKGCDGIINSALRLANAEIHWYCPKCENEGIIFGWQGSKWDNRHIQHK
jgi:hypothetical protein